MPDAIRRVLPQALVGVAAVVWAAAFGWLAVTRHLAGGSHAEDLGWTDQVLNNFLRGQWFRFSIYQGAAWNTELNVAALRRPDSLLAFHVEPMLLLLVVLYALGGTIASLLVLQALAFAVGAVPAYRIGVRSTGSRAVGVALACVYFLSPLGQWAVLADFHTVTLAAPLLLVTADLLLARRPAWVVLGAAGLAASAREDVAPVVAVLGLLALLGRGLPRRRGLGLSLVVGGVAWTAASALVIRAYSGGLSPFDARYAGLHDTGPLALLLRPLVLGYASTLLLSGGWLAVFAPAAVLPAVPSVLVNVLSSSDWMASGRAHYSALIPPFIVLGAAGALGRIAAHARWLRTAVGALLLSSGTAYLSAGAGPVAANFVPASVTVHAERAAAMADRLPEDAAVSATSSLVPHLTRRARVYVFPAVLDADYVFLDLHSSPAPTSAGDVFLRVQALLAEGDWQVQVAEDGLLLLERTPNAAPANAQDVGPRLFALADSPKVSTAAPASISSVDGTTRSLMGAGPATLTLLDARLVPSSDAAVDVDGPHWTLRTTWRTPHVAPPAGARLHFWLDLGASGTRDVWDLASLWWNPPELWPPDTTVTIDVPDVPVLRFRSWQAAFE